MKRFIHKHLSAHYYVGYKPNKKGEHIFFNKSTRSITSKALTRELSLLFGLERAKLKWYIKSWTKKQGKSFNFIRWWNPKHYFPKEKKFKFKYSFNLTGFELPIIQRVLMQTVANDLVEVQPMRPPTGLFPYFELYGGVDVARDDVQDVAIFEPYVNENTREMTVRRWRNIGMLEPLRPHMDYTIRLNEEQRNQFIW